MSKQNIDTGTAGNPATGDTLRGAMLKVNSNFDELYSLVGADLDTGLITPTKTNGNLILQPNGTGVVEIDQLQITDDDITSLITNGTIAITGNGTGGVDIEALSITGTSISSSDSTTININDNLIVAGLSITGNTITTKDSNANLELTAAGTGAVKVDAILSLPDGSDSDNYAGFGDADDLKIFHNGSHSIIRETGTGNLFLQSDHERSLMGSQGYDLVSKHFTWEHVSKQFKQLYSWNLGLISSAPDFVQASL